MRPRRSAAASIAIIAAGVALGVGAVGGVYLIARQRIIARAEAEASRKQIDDIIRRSLWEEMAERKARTESEADRQDRIQRYLEKHPEERPK